MCSAALTSAASLSDYNERSQVSTHWQIPRNYERKSSRQPSSRRSQTFSECRVTRSVWSESIVLESRRMYFRDYRLQICTLVGHRPGFASRSRASCSRSMYFRFSPVRTKKKKRRRSRRARCAWCTKIILEFTVVRRRGVGLCRTRFVPISKFKSSLVVVDFRAPESPMR
jgi:hypothetical protein